MNFVMIAKRINIITFLFLLNDVLVAYVMTVYQNCNINQPFMNFVKLTLQHSFLYAHFEETSHNVDSNCH